MSLQYQTPAEEEAPIQDEVAASMGVRPPTPSYTYFLLVCIGLTFAAQYLFSLDPQFFSGDRFSAIVAGFDKRQFLNGEYWRIFTGAVIHSGILHVGFNAYALYSFGRLMELLTNRAHLAIVFLLAALGGGLLSLLFLPDVTSVGASGGIVGLIGYLAVYAFKRRQFISPQFRRNLLINIGFIFVYGLVLYKVIDNFGHLGGLITGAIYGLVQIPTNEYVDPREAGPAIRIMGYSALGIYAAAAVIAVIALSAAASHFNA